LIKKIRKAKYMIHSWARNVLSLNRKIRPVRDTTLIGKWKKQ